MKKIPLTQGKFALVDDEDYAKISKFKWYLHSGGYAATSGIGKVDGKVRRYIYMHRIVNQTFPGMDTDHINGNKLDNRKENLRSCNRSGNAKNVQLRKNSLSGFKGVHWHKGANKWRSQIQKDKIKFHIGFYEEIKDAARAYNEAALKYHGEFARLNKI